MGKKIGIIVLIMILMTFVIALGYSAIHNKGAKVPEEGSYKTVHEVSGVSFAINSNIANKATAISEISEKINIDRSLFYSYKDGGNKYILFGMDSIAVAVEKGTHFNLSKNMTAEDVEGASVCGMWFEKNGRTLQIDTDHNSATIQVNGGLNISNETYTDYVGELRILTDGQTQWAIFCGIPSNDKFKNLNKNTQESIDAIVRSLQFSDYEPPVTEDVYVVSIGNETEESTEVESSTEIETVTEAESAEESTEIASSEEVSGEETTAQESETETESEAESESAPASEENTESTETESETETATESAEETSEETTSNEEIIVPEESEESTEASYVVDEPKPEPEKKAPMDLDNQKKIANKKSSEAYSSDIYSMLSLKDNGIISEFDIPSKKTVTPIINISRVYKGKTAVDMIKKYCKETGEYKYFDAPVGCEWHIAEYNLLYKNCEEKPYINIKLRGMDGRNIICNGIKYSKRTYDMFGNAEWKGDYYGTCYCFYAVPIGITEYSLECGMGTVDYDTNSRAAYYHIKY